MLMLSVHWLLWCLLLPLVIVHDLLFSAPFIRTAVFGFTSVSVYKLWLVDWHFSHARLSAWREGSFGESVF